MINDKAREALREKFKEEVGKPFTTWLPAIEKNDVLIFTDEYVEWLEQAVLSREVKLQDELEFRKAVEDYAQGLEKRLREIWKIADEIPINALEKIRRLAQGEKK